MMEDLEKEEEEEEENNSNKNNRLISLRSRKILIVNEVRNLIKLNSSSHILMGE